MCGAYSIQPQKIHIQLWQNTCTHSTYLYLGNIALFGIHNPHMPFSYILCSHIYSSAFPSYVIYCKRLHSTRLIPQASLPSSFWVDLASGRHWQETGEQGEGRSQGMSSPPSGNGCYTVCRPASIKPNNDPLKSLLQWFYFMLLWIFVQEPLQSIEPAFSYTFTISIFKI